LHVFYTLGRKERASVFAPNHCVAVAVEGHHIPRGGITLPVSLGYSFALPALAAFFLST
jgi:hypothetical protein